MPPAIARTQVRQDVAEEVGCHHHLEGHRLDRRRIPLLVWDTDRLLKNHAVVMGLFIDFPLFWVCGSTPLKAMVID